MKHTVGDDTMHNAISQCRSCGSRALTPVLSLGGGNGWAICDPEKDPTACGLLQRLWDMPKPDVHEIAVSRTGRHRLRATTTGVMEMISARDSKALDIGCGDGTLLTYLPRWIECCGIDRHPVPPGPGREAGTFVRGDFPSKSAMRQLGKVGGREKFDIITAISVLGEQDDPLDFLQAVRQLLARDGVAVIETPYASLALMRNNPSAFHAEAQALYSLQALENLVTRAGLKIVRGGMTETAGGSLRVYLSHEECHDYTDTMWLNQLARLWDEEASLALDAPQTYQAFSWRMERNRQQAQEWIAGLKRTGSHIHLIGADAGSLFLADWVGLDRDVVSAVISRDPDLHGCQVKLGGGMVDILCEREQLEPLPVPDAIIAPAGLRREALEHWREAIFEGAELAFLSPDFARVTDRNYGAELGKALAVTDGPGSVDTLRAVLASVQRPQLVSVSTASNG